MGTVSACIIARDEEALLPDCLASLAGWVDQICVLDTGSKDGTVEVEDRYRRDEVAGGLTASRRHAEQTRPDA